MAVALRVNRSVGMMVLGIYLIVVGATAFVPLAIPHLALAVLAGVAGVLILIGR